MRIERITVSNYRGARQCDVAFRRGDNVAVFAGVNGSGKTSCIEACRWCLGQGYGLRPIPAYPYEVAVAIIGNDGVRYTIRRTQDSHIAMRGDGVAVPVTQDFLRLIGAEGSWYFSSWRDPLFSNGVDLQVGKDASGHVPGATREETLEYIKNALVRMDVTAQFNKDSQQIAQVREIFNRLSAARNMFFPNAQGTFVSRSVSAVLTANGFKPGMLKPDFKFELYLKRNSDSRLVAVNDFSSGELEILCFLGVLLLIPSLSIVYIDEPELHLNQQWHSMLLRALQIVSPNAQFIVGTHSQEIWNSVYPSQRFLLTDGRCVNV